MNSYKLLTYITPARVGYGSGYSTTEKVLNYQDDTQLYDMLVDSSENFSGGSKTHHVREFC